ncbi:hypothetical protein L6164_025937 [Bauhinia variegata]|uniref:Uncharacterized protein n=1 Tax=Bauhinia variegata TaxID=167791 RepID=A0ACB9M3L8_BAUVA|nr:hypothetical protein L6164_025937 [Bauhinia variegata]
MLNFFSCLFIVLLLKCEAQVPNLLSVASHPRALYVFGDSTVDCGLNTSGPSYHRPYACDSPLRGRFSNGYTVVDLLGLALNLTVSMPFWENDKDPNSIRTWSFDYADAPTAILSTVSINQTMKIQIKHFEEHIKEYSPKFWPSANEVSNYLSKSIFVISIGTRDILDYYFDGNKYLNASGKISKSEFSDLLISELQKYLTELYELGARMILVFEIGPIGCYPIIVGSDKPPGWCLDELNDIICTFNGKLYHKLTELASTLEGSTFILAKIYKQIYDIVEYPDKHGLEDTKNPCCLVNKSEEIYCTPYMKPCKRTDQFLFWDKLHLTERANDLIASQCLNDTDMCLPITSQESIPGTVLMESGKLGHHHNILLCACSFLIQVIQLNDS